MNQDEVRREAAKRYKREYRARMREQKEALREEEMRMDVYGGPFYVHLHHQDGFRERIKERERSTAEAKLQNCRRMFGAELVRSFIGTLDGVPV